MEVSAMKSNVAMKIPFVQLGDIISLSKGKKHEPNGNGKNRYINIENLHNSANSLFTNEEGTFVVEDDLIIAWDGANAGKVGVGFVGVIGSTLARMRIKSPDVSPRYLFWYLESINEWIKSQRTGATIPHVNGNSLKEIQIPLPPLSTQKRIAEILDAADALRRKDQELLKKYDELAQAIFIDMFGDPVKNEKGWEVKTIEDLVVKTKHSIKRGPFGGALKKEIFVNEGYLVFEQFHALNNDFSFERYYISEEKYKELIAFDVKPGDIIISCSGIYLGKLAIVPEGVKPGIINQALLKLTLNESVYKNEFFLKVFTQENFKETYFSSERGAAIPNFPPMSSFKEFKFICPPIELQDKYLRLIEKLQSQLREVSNSKQCSTDLFQTLIRKAFNGELVK
jgi:type I restriction enzyme S subunit